ncbi:type II toxin-antitoxin system VapC family toxin [Nocardia cyriacigeorgica]|uniref:type II toxin-antitoxin system VapC family toxin n=1 Tax=Nocardia cyriacigeorgica TaxID=135487 RepID=UPI00189504DF|nr:PIN domain-containing protein [Nocardia cyriacigeorgica]MBF6452270.1 PIN domain-containing protein [Nocardia cyriacigeorgica]MBF6481556.1 PIN domain-containing protein [Nocardia cyriacigeorgica]MBF6549439.1 PIN domain-containing protein [Nocardia cyriacigeorgica]
MTAPFSRPLYLIDHSVMSHYRTSEAVKLAVDRLAVSGVLCSSMVTMDEARYSARNAQDLTFITELYGSVFHWLATDAAVEGEVARIRKALWKIGAGRGAQTTDIQIAATALRHSATVVHNDRDFQTIHRAVPEFDQLRVQPEHGGTAPAP